MRGKSGPIRKSPQPAAADQEPEARHDHNLGGRPLPFSVTSFQFHESFHVIAVVPHYLTEDPETPGFAAVVEWLNPLVIQPEHYADRPSLYIHRDAIARQLMQQ